MKKILLAFSVVAIFCVGVVDRNSYRKASWPQEIVESAVNSTVIVYSSNDGWVSLGTGVALSKEGLIVTAAHVVDGGDKQKIHVVTRRGATYEADVVEYSSISDTALILPRRSAHNFVYSKLSPTGSVRVGEDVLIVGHPHGDMYTVTTGIVARIVFSLNYLCRILETDATINPGNSGGGMFNQKGEVIGIVSAMRISRFDGVVQKTGIGIVVYIGEAKKLVKKYYSKNPTPPFKRYQLQEVR